jgi:hypothetical protein
LVTSSLTSSPTEAVLEEIQEMATATHLDAVGSGETGRIRVTGKGLERGGLATVLLPKGWELQVRRFGETSFRPPGESEFWEFNGAGICEPIELMLTDGADTIRVAFDPLTAEVLLDEP